MKDEDGATGEVKGQNKHRDSCRGLRYHGSDDGGGGGDLVVGGPLRGQGDRVEEEGLQDVLSEGDVVRTLPAQDHRRRTQGVNSQLADAGGL